MREITGLDENAINQTIEACKDGTGRYSLEQVISLLFDDSSVRTQLSLSLAMPISFAFTQLRNNLQRSTQSSNNHSPTASNVPVQNASANASFDRTNVDTITDDVIEISPEPDNQPVADDELERYDAKVSQ